MAASHHVLITATQVGQMLQSSRKSRKLSQVALATQIGVGQSRVSYLEQHAGDLSLAQLLAWCAALGLELRLGPKEVPPDTAPSTDW